MHISRPKLIASAAAVLALAALLATPQLLGSRVSDALDSLAGANRFWLALGALGFLGGVLATGGARRAGPRGGGGRGWPRPAGGPPRGRGLGHSFAPAQ